MMSELVAVFGGFRILGNGRDLPRLVQERGIDQVVVTIDELPAASFAFGGEP